MNDTLKRLYDISSGQRSPLESGEKSAGHNFFEWDISSSLCKRHRRLCEKAKDGGPLLG